MSINSTRLNGPAGQPFGVNPPTNPPRITSAVPPQYQGTHEKREQKNRNAANEIAAGKQTPTTFAATKPPVTGVSFAQSGFGSAFAAVPSSAPTMINPAFFQSHQNPTTQALPTPPPPRYQPTVTVTAHPAPQHRIDVPPTINSSLPEVPKPRVERNFQQNYHGSCNYNRPFIDPSKITADSILRNHPSILNSFTSTFAPPPPRTLAVPVFTPPISAALNPGGFVNHLVRIDPLEPRIFAIYCFALAIIPTMLFAIAATNPPLFFIATLILIPTELTILTCILMKENVIGC